MTRTSPRRPRTNAPKGAAQSNGWSVSKNPGVSTIGQVGVVAGVIALCGTTGLTMRELRVVEELGLLAIPVAVGLIWGQVWVVLRVTEMVKGPK